MGNGVSSEKVYVEDGYVPIPNVRLNDVDYGRALQSFVVVCTDAVIVDPERRTLFLAKRKSKPMTGWWVIGGRTSTGESKEESVRRCFLRETKLASVDVSRFVYLCTNEYFWKNRQQEPQDTGCHCLARTFKIVLTAQERKSVSDNLESNEYDRAVGLREFTRKDLVKENVHGAILDVYDMIFP